MSALLSTTFWSNNPKNWLFPSTSFFTHFMSTGTCHHEQRISPSFSKLSNMTQCPFPAKISTCAPRTSLASLNALSTRQVLSEKNFVPSLDQLLSKFLPSLDAKNLSMPSLAFNTWAQAFPFFSQQHYIGKEHKQLQNSSKKCLPSHCLLASPQK